MEAPEEDVEQLEQPTPPTPPEPPEGPPEDKGPPLHINLVLARDATASEVANAAIAAYATALPPGQLQPEREPEPIILPPGFPGWPTTPTTPEEEEVEPLEGEVLEQVVPLAGQPGIRVKEPPPPLEPSPEAPPADIPEGP